MILVHASCVDLGGAAVILRGPSGAGKSDLALRLIDGGGLLVADDQVRLHANGGMLMARAPETIRGQLEVRGVGILAVPSTPVARVALVADLVPAEQVERLPDPAWTELAGIRLPLLLIAPFEVSAAAKIRFAMAQALARQLGAA
ncbi:MAG: HPr kinase/phosphatase C-terminal domain-containing protein [Alphaproteobacteria bacterium]|nr:HPr kinase/phosphatase C-terminal domain-containing protein [Alphaproteobacteria bacterium]